MSHNSSSTILFNFQRYENYEAHNQELRLEIYINLNNKDLQNKFKELIKGLPTTGVEVLEPDPELKVEGIFHFRVHKIDALRPMMPLFKEENSQLTHLDSTNFTRQGFLELGQKLLSYCQKAR